MTTRDQREQLAKMTAILGAFVEAVETDGRLFLDAGLVHAEIPPLDAGTAYIHACEALGRTPKLLPVQEGEG